MPGRLSRKRPAEAEPEEDSQAEDETVGHGTASLAPTEAGDDDERDANSSLNDMAKRLVRLALAHESQRRPLRRQDIGDKVLGKASRQFKKVFAQAQHELRTVFGMELVELPARDRLTLAQRRAAQQKANTAKPQATSWALVSILPREYRDPSILVPSAVPESSVESTYTGLYTVLTSLVTLNGGQLTETRLEHFLRKLRLSETTPLHGSDKTDLLLKRMEKDGYLVKIREKIGTSGEEEISYALGPRAKVEVGNAGVRGLVQTVYGQLDKPANDELVKKLERSLGAAQVSTES